MVMATKRDLTDLRNRMKIDLIAITGYATSLNLVDRDHSNPDFI